MVPPIKTLKPKVITSVGAGDIIPEGHFFATYINNGGANGTIDYGDGVITLLPGLSITMPPLGFTYDKAIVDGTGTSIEVVFVV